MSDQHKASFKWGAGPQSVFIAGGFNNWSDSATPLEKQADGSFAADVPVPWGEKQAFKYVVDGEWKVREDEAKEWDAAGNMNNVYTAPAAPESSSSAAAAESKSDATTVPPSTAPDSPPPTKSTTEASTLLAASAPAAASGGSDAPAAAATPEKIEKTAAEANVGAEKDESHDKTIMEQAAEYGAGAAAALGAVVGSAAVAVEKATGIDITNHQPMTVEEAKAKGIDVDTLEKKDAPTDTVPPSAPAKEDVKDLEDKTRALKTADSRPNDIPAQDETEENHKEVPAPDITAVGVKDASKDRSEAAGAVSESAPTSDTAGTKPISSDPAVDAKEKKDEAESKPTETGSTPAAAAVETTKAPETPAKAPTPTPPAKAPTPTPPAAAAPATPATNGTKETPKPATGTSTPASTPGKATPTGDVKKRKSGFFGKLKNAFSSPKENKEKK